VRKEYRNDYVDCNQNQNCIHSADKSGGFVDMDDWWGRKVKKKEKREACGKA